MRNTKIAWTMDTWNPWRGCSMVSKGCERCYAMGVAYRYSNPGQPYDGLATQVKGKARWTNQVRFVPHVLNKPLQWREPRLIFVNSMSDMFHESIPIDEIQLVFDIMRKADWHTFQILTKRAERLEELNSVIEWPKNVWMGVSVEDQENTYRIPHLQRTDAAIKFISMEPLIGPIEDGLNLQNIDWVIVGGESGNGARYMNAEWALSILDNCKSWGIPFFMKQMGTAWAKLTKVTGVKDYKGENIEQFPTKLQVREYPDQPEPKQQYSLF